MKKVIMIAVAALSLMAAGIAESSAQIRFGVMGGATFSKMSKEVIKGENMTQFHAGGTVQLRLSATLSCPYQSSGDRISFCSGLSSMLLLTSVMVSTIKLQWRESMPSKIHGANPELTAGSTASV